MVMPDLCLALAFCHALPREEFGTMSKALVPLFERNGNSMSFLHALIRHEVNNTNDGGTLFRLNSVVSNMLSTYFHFIGNEYLRQLLSPLISNIFLEDISMEIDPSKISEGENVESNLQNLITASQKVLDAIVASVEYCPKSIKYLCYFLLTEVQNKFPDSIHIAIGGFYFLRYVLPALVSPDGFAIIDDTVNLRNRRSLVLISKLLQNVSNQQQFKEGLPSFHESSEFLC